MKKYFFSFYWQRCTTLLRSLISSSHPNPDRARRDRVLFTLLLFTIPALWFITAMIIPAWAIYPFGISFVFIGLFVATKKGQGAFASWIFLALSFLLPAYASYTWGVGVPQSLLTYALVIVMTTILLGSVQSYIVTLLISIFLLVLAQGQLNGTILSQQEWRTELPNVGNAIAYSLALGLIAVVSWLFHRQTEHALKKAREFEIILLKERDELEKTVYKRTQELRQSQTARLNEFYQFAELGRQASGFLHDIANPLNVINLSLDHINQTQSDTSHRIHVKRSVIRNAILATRNIEDYIRTTRQSLQHQEHKTSFSLMKEIRLALRILQPKIEEQHIQITVKDDKKKYRLLGNNVKFHQVINNLLSNAIDAYKNTPLSEKKKIVTVTLSTTKKHYQITVADHAGGIPDNVRDHIFEPFFSTKQNSPHLGIGLSICKNVVEQEFGGTIRCVSSQPKKVTKFIISLPK